MPLTDKKRKEIFKKADLDNDDLIDYEEFVKSIEENDSYLSKETIFFRTAFWSADKDEDGLISAEEFG